MLECDKWKLECGDAERTVREGEERGDGVHCTAQSLW